MSAKDIDVIRSAGLQPSRETRAIVNPPPFQPDLPLGEERADMVQAKTEEVQETESPRPIPEMGWQAYWYRLTKLFNPSAEPPRLSKREAEYLAEQARLEAERLAEEKRLADEEAARQAEELRKVELRASRINEIRTLSDQTPTLRVAFVGIKGAAATTTTAAYCASVAGEVTRAALVASDFNPASGTLAARLGRDFGETITLREFRAQLPNMGVFSQFITRLRPTKYSVRALSANDIVSSSEHLTGEDAMLMLDTVNINTEYHFMDTANDVTNPVTLAVIEKADVLVFTAYVNIQDGLRQLATSMETLRAHGFEDKVNRSVVVISGVEPGNDLDEYHRYLNRTNIRGEVVVKLEDKFQGPFLGVPYDEVIRRDAEVDLEALYYDTLDAYMEIVSQVFNQHPDNLPGYQASSQLDIKTPDDEGDSSNERSF